MNDQQVHAGYVGYDAHPTGSYPTTGYPATGYSTGTFAADPLFGDLPGHDEPAHSGQYDTTQWDTGAQQTAGYDAVHHAQPVQQSAADTYGTTGQWSIPAPACDQQAPAAGYDTTGQWDANAWNTTGQFETPADATTQWPPPTQGYGTASAYDTNIYGAGVHGAGVHGADIYNTGAYATDAYATGDFDATAWNSAGASETTAPAHGYDPAPGGTATATAADDPQGHGNDADEPADTTGTTVTTDTTEFTASSVTGAPEQPTDDTPHGSAHMPYEPPPGPAARRPSGSRGRRRTPARRSALLTVAVPSVCVMGVAGVAAATVGDIGDIDRSDATTRAAADPSSVKSIAANSKLDTQLANLSHEADDFADRASRTQERIDLKERQADAKKLAAVEAARQEAARAKFVLPVKRKGLSAYFGQAGVNWMSVHTGIDFPVSYGTPVMAATDGTVRTQWNSAYGNMAMVTAPDGTETWYCHLSSTKIRSGTVKAGDVIAYSGNSGNSTGPHMHFEVHPHAGAAVDPLPWLRSHGLDPT